MSALPERMRHRRDFLRAARGWFRAMPAVVVQMHVRGDAAPPRVGFTATRRIGKAVVRNRARRRLREIVRQLPAGMLLPGRDYVFIARETTADCPHLELRRQVQRAVAKLNAGEGRRATPGRRPPRRPPPKRDR